MAITLRHGTSSQEVPFGPFLDATDGNTQETGLTIANTDIKLWKAGTTSLVNKNSGGGTHMAQGVYSAVLDATDTDTVGPLILFVHVAGALAVRLECIVLTTTNYDAAVAGSIPASANVTQWVGNNVTSPAVAGVPNVNITHISGDSPAADNLEQSFDDTPGASRWLGIIDQGTAQAATASTLQFRAAAAFADDELIGAVVTITGGDTGVGQSRQITDYVASTDTATIFPNWTVTPTGTITYAVRVAIREQQVNTIQAAGVAWGSGAITAASIATGALTAAKFASGAFDAVWTVAARSLTNVQAIWEALVVDFSAISGSFAQRLSRIPNVAPGANGGLPTVDASNRIAGIQGTINTLDGLPTVATIADGVWDEAIAGHLSAGSTGAALNGAGAAGDPWTTPLPGAYGAGTAGNIIGTRIDAAITSRLATAGYTAPPSAATNAAAVRSELTTELGRIDVATSTRLASASFVAAPTALENADALLGRDLGSGALAGTLNERSVRSALRWLRNKWDITGGTLTARKEDDTTTAWTATVTQTAGNPVSGSDPS